MPMRPGQAAHLETTRQALRLAAMLQRRADQLLDLYQQLAGLPAEQPDDRAITQRQTAAKAVLNHFLLLQRLLPALQQQGGSEAAAAQIDAAALAAMLQGARRHAEPAADSGTDDEERSDAVG